MREADRLSLLKDITRTIVILSKGKSSIDFEKIKELSDHTIKDVALYKSTDAVSLAILIYSIYKTVPAMSDEDFKDLIAELKFLEQHISAKNLRRYNQSLKVLFNLIRKSNSAFKTHINDVFHAAKLKKGVSLFDHGLSASRTAELMGLTKWELLEYMSKTTNFDKHHEKVKANERYLQAEMVFSKKNRKKVLFFDAGPIITLAMSRLLWILEPLKIKFGGKFYITPAVRTELIERPLKIKRFEFEALQVLKLIRDGVLEIYPELPYEKTQELTKLSNKTYKVDKKWIEIIQAGEMETVIASMTKSKSSIVMDERTMRLLLEDSDSLKSLLERRSRKPATINEKNVKDFNQKVGKINIIRSIELVSLAFKFGFLDQFLPKLPNAWDVLLDSVLWNVKYNGCAVTEHEVLELKEFLLKNYSPKFKK